MVYILALIACIAFPKDSTRYQMESFVVKNLPNKWDISKKKDDANRLVNRIIIESNRYNLDPIIVLSIARIESNFHHWVSRKNDDSHGIYQTIRLEKSTIDAAKEIAGCNYSHLKMPYRRSWARYWARKLGKVAQCTRQDIAASRAKSGPFSVSELKDPNHVISTWVAVREIAIHIKKCEKREHKHSIYGCKLSLEKQREIARYGHYNAGPFKLRHYYLYRLCQYYTEIVGIK